MGKMNDKTLEEKDFSEKEKGFELEQKEKEFFPDIPLSKEEEEQLTEEKRRAEAEDRERDIADGWEPHYK